jgi:hypothetical protein
VEIPFPADHSDVDELLFLDANATVFEEDEWTLDEI